LISAATQQDYSAIIDVWESSVRATHDFLPEDYLQQIKTLLPSILPQIQLYVWKDDSQAITGFVGVAEDKMEMLFLHPGSMGKGIGRKLTEFCINVLHAYKTDVNEDNKNAVAFYKKIGYVQTGRQDTDSLGRPFSLLQMQFEK